VVPEKYYTLSPYKFPKEQGKVQASTTFGRDGQAVFKLAVAYRMTGDSKYAAAAARLLGAWADGLKTIDARNSNTALSVSSGFPTSLAGADLLEGSVAFGLEERARFRKFVREVVVASRSAELCMRRTNNWANFGVVLSLTLGAYLDDDGLFDRGIKRWKELVETQMTPEGVLHEEVKRPGGQDKRPGLMGIWYSNFSLMPATYGAEVARVNGVDLFGYRTASGKSLEVAYRKVVPWLKDPGSFPYFSGDPSALIGVKLIPYFELLVPRWADGDAAAMLAAERPVRAKYGFPNPTFTHGDLVEDR
jgi:hypothetical protein